MKGKNGFEVFSTSPIDFTNCFYNINTIVQGKPLGPGYEVPPPTLYGLDYQQMTQSSHFINAGWDFDKIWTIVENHSFPFFQWQQDRILVHTTSAQRIHANTVRLKGYLSSILAADSVNVCFEYGSSIELAF